ncbi:unnamed protein product [Didymodactylos carnosus]|uniref:Uncharacterized protein n=1 Tax=Didymodactylos carnosus TaxID=1234261 RepID=A0A814USU0_9BILA|nr:unnamed protein product [Didymodactylos carnosus]CAF1179990.1 unnamed protein product [Didymodactylos carnosus]CAF3656658.1 unnamed protein product [Didymodactylos carnosus]CAF3944279.1 unnamed protein product [Didymodactylos carnosus]
MLLGNGCQQTTSVTGQKVFYLRSMELIQEFRAPQKNAPYEVMFGQPSRSDPEFWKLVDQNNIVDENDLPTPVSDMDGTVISQKYG